MHRTQLSLTMMSVPYYDFFTDDGRPRLLGKVMVRRNDAWPITKTLEGHDVRHRLLLSPADVHDHLEPYWAEARAVQRGEALPVVVCDVDTSTEHTLLFTRARNGSHYLQGGWTPDFVRRRELGDGDMVGLGWDVDAGHLIFGVVFRANLVRDGGKKDSSGRSCSASKPSINLRD